MKLLFLSFLLWPVFAIAQGTLKWHSLYQARVNGAAWSNQAANSVLNHKFLLRPTLLINDLFAVHMGFNLSGYADVQEAADSPYRQQNPNFNSLNLLDAYPFTPLQGNRATLYSSGSEKNLGLKWRPIISTLYADMHLKHALLIVGRAPRLWGKGLIYSESVWDDFLALSDQISLTAYTGRSEWNFRAQKWDEGVLNMNRDDRESFGASVIFRSKQENVKFGFNWDYVTWNRQSALQKLGRSYHLFDLYVRKSGQFFILDGEFVYITGSDDVENPRYNTSLPNHQPLLINRASVGFLGELKLPRIIAENTFSVQVGVGQGDSGDTKPKDDASRYGASEKSRWAAGIEKPAGQAEQGLTTPELREGHDNRFFFNPSVKPALLLMNQAFLAQTGAVNSHAIRAGYPSFWGQDLYSADGEFLGNGCFYLNAAWSRPLLGHLFGKLKATSAWFGQANPQSTWNGKATGSFLGSELDLSLNYVFEQDRKVNAQLGIMLPGNPILASQRLSSSQPMLGFSLSYQMKL